MSLVLDVFLNLLLLVAGFILLSKGADFFVDGAANIAARFKIPQLVIGLTVVAMGTSLPEAAVSVSAALKGTADITVGNVLGSNIINVLIILGVSAVITPLAVSRNTLKKEIPIMLGATLLFLALGFSGTITRWGGALLLVCFIGFLVMQILVARKEMRAEETAEPLSAKKEKQPKLWVSVFFTLLGCGAIILGSESAVNGATALAKIAHISDRFIGLTIVALGTSLPELFTSVTAAIKKNADIAIGNIVGSNIFNLLFIAGMAATIIPVPFQSSFRIDTLVSLGAGLLLLLFALGKKHQLGRVGGAVMLASYAAYFVYLVAA